MEESCIFCKIALRELPSHVVYEDDLTMAFLDIHPTSKGHTLIIPKSHANDFISSPTDTLLAVTRTMQSIAPAVIKAVEAEGFNVHFNNGSVAGQVIFHLHGHIIPRFPRDGRELWKGGSYRDGEAAEIAEKIKNMIN